MIHHFPHEAAFLPRTKLSYVNLPGILSDGKRDRAARVCGFVCIQLGERCYLIFLRNGEPFHSARLQAEEGRGAAALSEVLRIAATESERGEAGQIGYFGAPEAQLQAMLATLVQEPVEWAASVDCTRPELLFPQLRQRQFTGVLELCAAGRHHYMIFEEGVFRSGYFTEPRRRRTRPRLRALRLRGGGGRTAGDPVPLARHPPRAGRPRTGGPLPPHDRRHPARALHHTRAVTPPWRWCAPRRQRWADAFPAARAFHLTDEGRVAGDPVASPRGSPRRWRGG
jgi:hypothetical protein